MIVKPEQEAIKRIKAAKVCPQCLGAGVFRSLIKRNGGVTTVLVDCDKCAGKGAAV